MKMSRKGKIKGKNRWDIMERGKKEEFG